MDIFKVFDASKQKITTQLLSDQGYLFTSLDDDGKAVHLHKKILKRLKFFAKPFYKTRKKTHIYFATRGKLLKF